MKQLELKNMTFSQKAEEIGACIIISNIISNEFESATENYYSSPNGEKKFCYEKITVCEYGFTSTCYISEDKIDNFLLLTADPKTIYFNITSTGFGNDVKKYIDYRWELKKELDKLDLEEDLFAQPDNVDDVVEPVITKYFKKELTNSYVDNHNRYLQIDNKLYANIGGGSNAGEVEWYKEVLDRIGIENIDYIIYKGKYRY